MSARKRHPIDWWHNKAVVGIYLLLFCIMLILSFINPSFFTLGSLTNTIGMALPLVFASMAQTLIVLIKGTDLSVGPTISLVNVFCASLLTDSSNSWNVFLVLLGALLLGVLVGFVNGGLVVLGGLQPIIVTLAMSSILSGIALFIMSQPGGSVPFALNWLVTGNIGFIPVPLLLLVGLSVAVWWPLRHSSQGQGMYSIGGNELSAFYSGVKVRKVTWITFMWSGLLAALAGILLTTQTLSGDPLIGAPYTLNSIAAVVLGGTSLAGGRGGVVGSIAGAMVLSVIVNLLFFLGVSAYYQYVISGLIVIIALAIFSIGNKQ